MKHYLCNIGLTVLILAVWGAAFYSLSGKSSVPSAAPGTNAEVAAQPSVKTYPGDERLGVLTREVHLDADKIKRKEVVNFRDGTVATVQYDSFGRLVKVREVRSSGDYLVFNFDPKKGDEQDSLKNLQVFRKNSTLWREMTPIKKGYESVYYAEDGKTRLCLQQVVEESLKSATFFHPDGVTKRAIYKASSNKESAVLSLYTDKGLLSSVQKISPITQGCDEDDECYSGSSSGTLMEVRYYHEDGKTIWFEIKATEVAAGSTAPGKTMFREFQADGKTLVRVVHEIEHAPEDLLYDEFGEEGLMASQNKNGFCAEIYDASGKIVKKRYLKDDFTVIRDELMKADGSLAEKKSYGYGSEVEEELKALMNKAATEDVAFLTPEYLFPTMEANHLDVTIAITRLEL